MHYWDTSALVKLYVGEPDSAVFAAHQAATGQITSSAIARWEVYRVFNRKEVDGLISPGAASTVFTRFLADVSAGNIVLLPMDNSVEARFQQLLLRLHRLSPPLTARTLDAIHLASADLHGAGEVVATDANLRKCAASIGLRLYPR
jgi:predicted nucleic acid-binding protein